MIDKTIEERLDRIEAAIAKIENMANRTHEILDVADLRLRLRIDNLEERISDLSGVERLAQAAYLKTHPDADAGVEAMKDSVFFARHEARIDARIKKQDGET